MHVLVICEFINICEAECYVNILAKYLYKKFYSYKQTQKMFSSNYLKKILLRYLKSYYYYKDLELFIV